MSETSPGYREVQTEYLSKEHAEKLIFHSFRFSQGSPEAQDNIFKWIHSQYPDYKVDESQMQDIRNDVYEASVKYIFNNKGLHTKVRSESSKEAPNELIDHTLIRQQAVAQSNNMFGAINSEQIYSKEEAIALVAQGIVEADLKYLVLNKDQKGVERPNLKAPSMSHFVTYGVEGKSTGIPEYDEMFVQVLEFVSGEFEKLKNKQPTKIKQIILANLFKLIENKTK